MGLSAPSQTQFRSAVHEATVNALPDPQWSSPFTSSCEGTLQSTGCRLQAAAGRRPCVAGALQERRGPQIAEQCLRPPNHLLTAISEPHPSPCALTDLPRPGGLGGIAA